MGKPMPPEPDESAPAPTQRLVIRARIVHEAEPDVAVLPKAQWRVIPLLVVAGVILASVWVGVRIFTDDSTAPSPARQTAPRVESPSPAVMPAPGEPAPAAAEPVAAGEADPSPSLIHEVIPSIPQSALQTIRGTIRVTVQVNVDDAGNVTAASAHVRGPSRYFERLCVEAASKWTFGPAEAAEPRVMLVKFTLKREGVTAEATPLK